MIRSLDPVPLGSLAQHMADEEWLDMAVCDLGILDRVKIETIHVHRDREDLTVLQEWCEFTPDNVKVERHTFAQQDVRWCRCTEIEDIREVHPPGWEPPPREFTTDEDVQRVWKAVADSAEFMYGVKRDNFTRMRRRGGKQEQGVTLARNSSMVAMYEWTELSQEKIAKGFFDGRCAASVSAALRHRRGQMDPFRKLVTLRVGSAPAKTYC